MQETLDNHEEFVEKTILSPIFFKAFGFNVELVNYYFGTSKGDSIREALWEAFKAGREYQFTIGRNF